MANHVRAALRAVFGDARQAAAFATRRLFNTAYRREPRGVAVALALVYLATSLAAYAWTMTDKGLASLWLGNGILAGGLLLLPADCALALCYVGWIIDLICCLSLGGLPLGRAVLIATIDVVEAVIMAILTRRACGAALNLTRVCRLAALVLAAILPATLATGLVYAFFMRVLFDDGSVWPFLIWFGGDLLSMTVALPAIILIARSRHHLDAGIASRIEHIAIAGGVVGVTLFIFAQPAAGSFLFLVPLAVLLATFRLSPSWSAVSIVMITFAAAIPTVAGIGPIAALEPDDMARRVLLLQLFLAAVALSSLLSSALVSERDLVSRRLARTLAAARQGRWNALQAVHAKGRFLHVMSHELRTPLNGVLGFAQIIAERPDVPAPARRQAGEIVKAGWSMVRLVDDVLEFAKLDANRVQLELAPFAWADVVDEAVANINTQLDGKPVALTVTLNAPGDVRHVGDARRIGQVVDHLLGNAVKFTDQGCITLGVDVEPGDGDADHCRITVRDTGPGISPLRWEELFQPFHQADNSMSRRYDGAGLGLALCRSLVAVMGGRIGVESHPGAGTEFVVELSLRHAEA